MFKKILVVVNQSDLGMHVFDEAVVLAKANNATLMLLHCLSPADEKYPSFIDPQVDDRMSLMHEEVLRYVKRLQELDQEALDLLKSLADKAIAAGVPAEFTQSIGDPGQVVCKLANTWDADLIVIGRRGHKGLTELLLGSASNYVLHHAPCSVLAVQGSFGNESQPSA